MHIGLAVWVLVGMLSRLTRLSGFCLRAELPKRWAFTPKMRMSGLIDKEAVHLLQYGPSTTTMLSFYRFFDVEDPEAMVTNARRLLVPHDDVKGTLYVAREGVNGQFSVPTTKLDLFGSIIESLDAREEALGAVDFNIGECWDNGVIARNPPFRKQIIRTRDKILRDRLPGFFATNRLNIASERGQEISSTCSSSDGSVGGGGGIDWTDAGPELPPEKWHEEVIAGASAKPATNKDTQEKIILLDCRNDYETEKGTFVGATALNTTVFSETWGRLEEELRGVDKSSRILTFCTG